MRFTLSFLLLALSLKGLSQDARELKHRAYVSTFSKTKLYPVSVEWWLTKRMLTCKTKQGRLTDFSQDPKLPKETNLDRYYRSSGYDRGHVFPAAYAECDKVTMAESFYYSNVMPQTPQLNRGDWKTVEELTKLEAREHDSVYVWAGGIGEIKKLGPVSVPTKCWKVVWVKKTNEYFCFLFDNDSSLSNGIADNRVELSVVQKLTGLAFKKK